MPALRLASWAALVATLVVSACGDGGSGDSGPSMAGTWDGGAIAAPGVFLNLTMTLSDDGGNVEGDGVIGVPGVDCEVGVTGDRSGDEFDLAITCPSFIPWTYRGTAGASRLSGRFDGSGFVNFRFDMIRE